MDRKQYALALALLLVAGLLGGALSGRLLAVAPTTTTAQAQPQSASSRPYAGQKWEYCALTKAAYVASNRGGLFWISYFRDTGVQVVEVEDTALERNGPAKAIAKLGDEGWEMITEGPLDLRQGELKAIYFRRPKP
ncbi:MAG: hypothetical protein WCF57_24885 [Pyrinomonadaceae bacterium]